MRIRLHHICYLVLSIMLLVVPQAAQAEKKNWEKQFQEHVQEWMNTIVSKDAQFKEWKKAKTDVQALGANQHQWIVSVTKSNKQVGYMIVGEVESAKGEGLRFVLLEYGVGEYILFDDAFAPKQTAAEPVYDGFSSYWQIAQNDAVQYVDGKTGERYPLTTKPGPVVMPTLSTKELIGLGNKVTKATILSAEQTDPFDQIGWLRTDEEDAMPKQTASWEDLLLQRSHQPVILSVSLFQDKVLAPFTVGSLHLWEDQAAYVGVWDEGLRFLPYAYASKVGTFIVGKE